MIRINRAYITPYAIPVSVSELKQVLRIDNTDEDTYLENLIKSVSFELEEKNNCVYSNSRIIYTTKYQYEYSRYLPFSPKTLETVLVGSVDYTSYFTLKSDYIYTVSPVFGSYPYDTLTITYTSDAKILTNTKQNILDMCNLRYCQDCKTFEENKTTGILC